MWLYWRGPSLWVGIIELGLKRLGDFILERKQTLILFSCFLLTRGSFAGGDGSGAVLTPAVSTAVGLRAQPGPARPSLAQPGPAQPSRESPASSGEIFTNGEKPGSEA